MSYDTSATLPSRPADHERPASSGAGPHNVNTGSGVQKNYNQSGGSHNRQFNADTIYYSEQAETRPEYTGAYSYSSLQPVASYVARPDLQKQIEERLYDARAARTAHTSILVLVGLGGAGKSQLALDYIRAHREEYSAVFWVDARLRQSLERDYIQIYCLLFGSEQNLASLQLDVERIITAVKTWFQGREGRWLFVFDNADSLDDTTDPYFVDLQRYLPDAANVEVMITTRSQTATWMTEMEAVTVGELTAAEACNVFVRCSKLRDPSMDVLEEVGRIVSELGYLALAVTLAGAYVAATPRIQSDVRGYLSEYLQRRKTLLSRKAKQQIHRYGDSVLSTWETSCAAIAKQCPTAVRLLSFFAFLDSADIFLELFRPRPGSLITPIKCHEDEWRGFLSVDAPFEEVLDEALEAMSTYSLIQWKEEQSGYSMHKLVHAWGFDRLEAEEQGEYSASSLAFLEWVIRDHQLDPVAKSRVTPHISSSVARLQEWRRTSMQVPESSLDLVQSLANFVRDTGQYDAEFELRSLEHEERGRLRGKDERSWLRSISDLAAVLCGQGKYSAAEEMNRRALEGYEKVLGKEHPDTLTSANNLAVVLRGQGELDAAAEMNQRVLEGREKVLEKEYPATLVSMGHLARVLQDQGKYSAAEEMYRRALEGFEKALEKEHPDTLISMNDLALVLFYQGKYLVAEKINRQVLEGYEKLLGKEHPETLTSVNNLTLVLMRQGKNLTAEQMGRRALEGYEKVLGKEHPDTLMSVNNLATVLQNQRNYLAAEGMHRRALEGREKVLGKKHPSTVRSLSNLALVLHYQGKYSGAEEMDRRALEGWEKMLGKEHPDTLTSAGNLAGVLQSQGKYSAAEEMNRRALEGREKVLGKEHPDTLMSVSNLASLLHYQGKYSAAEEMSRRALEGREKVLGKEHPSTLTSVNNLAVVLQDQGKHSAAEEMNRRAIRGKGEDAGEGASRHAEEYEQPRIDATGSRKA